MTNIILVGLRGSGKSQTGKKLAKTMKRMFADTDREIEKQVHCTTSALIERKGWNFFRKKEKYVCRRVSKFYHAIIATGGGAVMDKENAKHFKKHGFIVYIKVPTQQLVERLTDDTTRPALTAEKTLFDEIEAVREKREATYLELADLVYEPQQDTDDVKKDLKRNVAELNELLGKANKLFARPE
jgi:shikimate kinase